VEREPEWAPPTAAAFVEAAQSYMGVPYQAGGGHGENPHPLTGLDPAGLVRMALWTASGEDPGDGDCEAYRHKWKPVEASAALPGDVLYFVLDGDRAGPANHCAIMVGDGACVQAPEPSASVSQGPVGMYLQAALVGANRPCPPVQKDR
jgi:cell wall-associated NlpC family hydrolase